MEARQFLISAMVASLFAGGALPLGAQQQTGRIEGTVIDARSQRPLASASVFIQGSGIGSQTNDRGRFVIVNVPVGELRISVRRIGFNTAQKADTVVSGQTVTIDFPLSEAAISLDEVVVTGTAVATRSREVATSTDIVNMDAMKNAPVVDAQQVIAGRVPSVTIQANSGQPGEAVRLRIDAQEAARLGELLGRDDRVYDGRVIEAPGSALTLSVRSFIAQQGGATQTGYQRIVIPRSSVVETQLRTLDRPRTITLVALTVAATTAAVITTFNAVRGKDEKGTKRPRRTEPRPPRNPHPAAPRDSALSRSPRRGS